MIESTTALQAEERLARARERGLLEHGDPQSPGELGRRARLARVLVWAAEGRLAQLTRSAGEPAPFGLLNVVRTDGHWPRWRSRATEVFDEHLDQGRDHFELDGLAGLLDTAPESWPSPARIAAAASLARASSRARRVRAQALIHEGAREAAGRCLSRLLAPGGSRADRLVGCFGWARLYGLERRPGAARHALRAALGGAPLAPEVWRLAHALATRAGDRSTRARLARGARVVRRLERARESCTEPAPPVAEGPVPPPARPAPVASSAFGGGEGDRQSPMRGDRRALDGYAIDGYAIDGRISDWRRSARRMAHGGAA